MSRSYKKHYFAAFCGGSNHNWLTSQHQRFRSRERDILKLQEKYPEDDLVYPIFKEIANLWASPKDGSAYFVAYNFEHFFQNKIIRWHDIRWRWREPFPTRETEWVNWIRNYIGK
jgi:hypothetical protein